MSRKASNKKPGETGSSKDQQPQDAATQQPSQQAQYTDQTSAVTSGLENILQNIFAQLRIGGVPFKFVTTSPSPEERDLMARLNNRLIGVNEIPGPGRRGEKCIRPLSVAFPECSDVLLSLINTQNPSTPDDITNYFNDYFMFCDHSIMIEGPNADQKLDSVLDPKLIDCAGKWLEGFDRSFCQDSFGPLLQPPNTGNQPFNGLAVSVADTACSTPFQQEFPPRWPPPWCVPPTCVTLEGARHLYQGGVPAPFPSDRIRRLFIADLVWLFYFERMGIFKILGVILDDFAYKGRIPISNGIVSSGIRDDVVAMVLEAMTRKFETGLSSKVRGRASSYRRCLGWTSDVGRKLSLDTAVNTGFNNLYHKLIQHSLEFYKDKRLATAIQGVTVPVAKTSMATLITISDTLDLLKKSFDSFDYGRNYSNTLSGLVWVIAGMALIRELRTTLGIPSEYEQPYEYIPAAYDLLVMKRPITPSETNQYTLHSECANNARDILLDVEVVNHRDTAIGGELELWLNVIEPKVEGYRTAYRSLTGVDLGVAGTPSIEQQA